MQKETQHYVGKIFEIHKSLLHREFSYLKQKNSAYHQDDLNHFDKILFSQRLSYDEISSHITRFDTFKPLIKKELFSQPLNSQQQARFDEVFYKEDFLVRYLHDNFMAFSALLDKQHKALWDKEGDGVIGKIKSSYKRGAKKRLIDFLEQEEDIYSGFLNLYRQSTQTIAQEYSYEHWHQSFDKLKEYVLGASVAVTSVPLGPLELASLPLWGTYFSMREVEELDKNFKEWKNIHKHRIIKE